MRPIDKVLSALQSRGSKIKKTSNGWEANCPNSPTHVDDTASLSISTGSENKVILKCQADCRTEDIISSIGLEWKDLFEEIEKIDHRRVSYNTTYEYKKNGILVLQVFKTKFSDGKKKFYQRRPHKESWAYGLSASWYKKNNGEWKILKSDNGENNKNEKPQTKGEIEWIEECERPLYRFDEIAKALSEKKTIYIAEGEKDVETLVEWGFDATCNLMGAGKWKEEYSKLLSRSKVVVLSDMDKAGLEHSLHVCKDLKAHGCTVKCILPQDGNKDITDWKEAGLTKEQFCTIVKEAELFDQGKIENKKSEVSSKKKKSVASILVDMVVEETELFNARGSTGIVPYTTISVNEHKETYPVKADGVFKDWLSMEFFRKYRKSPSRSSIVDSVSSITGIAKFERTTRNVFIRVGDYNEKIYVDLADEKWRAVEIDENGWRIIDKTPEEFRFVRPFGTEPFPEPQPGGNWQELKEILNYGNEENWIMIVSWIVAAFRTRKPFPILNIDGEQGSAKSTASKIVRRLVDPNTNSIRIAPRNEEAITVSARNTWVLAFDNLSGLSQPMSDTLCSIATGAGTSTRKLYTDEEEVFFYGIRPIIINGIEGISSKPDLADRSLSVTLPAIGERQRKTEAEIWAKFNEIQPRILGLIFDAVSMALKNQGKIKFDILPRMADFATWIVAAETSLPWHPGKFLEAIHENRSVVSEFAIEASAVGSTITKFMTSQEEWHGTISQLLSDLNMVYPDAQKNKYWPSSARGLSTSIRKISQDLKRTGIFIDFSIEGRGSERKRTVSITRHETIEKQMDILRSQNSSEVTGECNAGIANNDEEALRSRLRSRFSPDNTGVGSQNTLGSQNSLSFHHVERERGEEKEGEQGEGEGHHPNHPTDTCEGQKGALLRSRDPNMATSEDKSTSNSGIANGIAKPPPTTQDWIYTMFNSLVITGKSVGENITEENRCIFIEMLRKCLKYNKEVDTMKRDVSFSKALFFLEAATI